MAYKRKSSIVPPREDIRRERARATGVTVKTYLNRSRLHEPLEKPAAKKIFAANESRAAAVRAMQLKRRATAQAGLKRKARGCSDKP